MKLKSLALLLLLPLLACATSEPIIGPDGTTQQLIHCGPIKLCYKKASEVCGGKYHIINTSNSVYEGSSTTDMLVKCGN